MKCIITSVKDRLRNYCTFELTETEELAKRTFSDIMIKSDIMKLHPEDYDLFMLGAYDNETGIIVPCEEPKLLMKGTEVLSK